MTDQATFMGQSIGVEVASGDYTMPPGGPRLWTFDCQIVGSDIIVPAASAMISPPGWPRYLIVNDGTETFELTGGISPPLSVVVGVAALLGIGVNVLGNLEWQRKLIAWDSN